MLAQLVHSTDMPNISINNIDPRIFSTKFACDLAACKGACCTFPGGYGAPITAEEVELLHQALAVVRNDLPRGHLDVIDRDGIIEHHNSALHIRCVNQRACVFVQYESGIAVCSIQRAYQRGAFSWVKPASCHLFPIRYSRNTKEGYLLRFEEFSECRPALENGRDQGMPLTDFLDAAISRVFGGEFAESLRRHATPQPSSEQ